MANYAVKESFLTLQGEGRRAGRRAVFIRFAGCNLWSGREVDRASAICRFCDTDFVGIDGDGGGRFASAAALAEHAAALWAGAQGARPYVVLTGGEPLLQVDTPLIDALHAAGFEIAVETNGTLPVPDGIDWICVSPKAGSVTVQTSGDELKLVWPQAGTDLSQVERWQFDNFLIQPLDDPDHVAHRDACVALVLARPQWRLTLQTHKMLGVR